MTYVGRAWDDAQKRETLSDTEPDSVARPGRPHAEGRNNRRPLATGSLQRTRRTAVVRASPHLRWAGLPRVPSRPGPARAALFARGGDRS
jgi:hypothetical protein